MPGKIAMSLMSSGLISGSLWPSVCVRTYACTCTYMHFSVLCADDG